MKTKSIVCCLTDCGHEIIDRILTILVQVLSVRLAVGFGTRRLGNGGRDGRRLHVDVLRAQHDLEVVVAALQQLGAYYAVVVRRAIFGPAVVAVLRDVPLGAGQHLRPTWLDGLSLKFKKIY